MAKIEFTPSSPLPEYTSFDQQAEGFSSFLFLALPKTNHYKRAFSLTQEWINHERKAESSFLFLSRTLSLILVDKSKRGKLLGEFQKRKKKPT